MLLLVLLVIYLFLFCGEKKVCALLPLSPVKYAHTAFPRTTGPLGPTMDLFAAQRGFHLLHEQTTFVLQVLLSPYENSLPSGTLANVLSTIEDTFLPFFRLAEGQERPLREPTNFSAPHHALPNPEPAQLPRPPQNAWHDVPGRVRQAPAAQRSPPLQEASRVHFPPEFASASPSIPNGAPVRILQRPPQQQQEQQQQPSPPSQPPRSHVDLDLELRVEDSADLRFVPENTNASSVRLRREGRRGPSHVITLSPPSASFDGPRLSSDFAACILSTNKLPPDAPLLYPATAGRLAHQLSNGSPCVLATIRSTAAPAENTIRKAAAELVALLHDHVFSLVPFTLREGRVAGVLCSARPTAQHSPREHRATDPASSAVPAVAPQSSSSSSSSSQASRSAAEAQRPHGSGVCDAGAEAQRPHGSGVGDARPPPPAEAQRPHGSGVGDAGAEAQRPHGSGAVDARSSAAPCPSNEPPAPAPGIVAGPPSSPHVSSTAPPPPSSSRRAHTPPRDSSSSSDPVLDSTIARHRSRKEGIARQEGILRPAGVRATHSVRFLTPPRTPKPTPRPDSLSLPTQTPPMRPLQRLRYLSRLRTISQDSMDSLDLRMPSTPSSPECERPASVPLPQRGLGLILNASSGEESAGPDDTTVVHSTPSSPILRSASAEESVRTPVELFLSLHQEEDFVSQTLTPDEFYGSPAVVTNLGNTPATSRSSASSRPRDKDQSRGEK